MAEILQYIQNTTVDNSAVQNGYNAIMDAENKLYLLQQYNINSLAELRRKRNKELKSLSDAIVKQNSDRDKSNSEKLFELKKKQINNLQEVQFKSEDTIYNYKVQILNATQELEARNIDRGLQLKLAAEAQLTELKNQNDKARFDAEVAFANKAAKQKADYEQKIMIMAISHGYKSDYAETEANIKKKVAAEEKAALKGVRKKKERAKIQADYEKKLQDELTKAKDADLKKAKGNLTVRQRSKLHQETYDMGVGSVLNATSMQAGLEGLGKTFDNFAEKTAGLDTGGKLSAALSAIADVAKQLDTKIDSIAEKQGAIETRLQGTSWSWEEMSEDLVAAAGISPLVTQEALANGIQTLVAKGIALNVEQRGALSVLKDKIATTFDATNSSLLRLVRIQSQDSTAARLGMESMINSFLNSMYQTSEYLTDAAASVRSNIEEASALMSAENAVAFEYQVQKWMGSLYSTGMSSSSVSNLSSALGKLAAGDVTAITSGGAGNLLVMAANNANLSIADILANGLDESSTNTLMQSAVSYLADLYNQASDSKVVQQQLATVFGVAASDLKAAVNLAKTSSEVAASSLSYSQAIGQMYGMADSMYERTSYGEMLNNVWNNVTYSLASTISSSPVLYGIYKAANLMDGLFGGIELPDIKFRGTGINLQTSVADILQAGVLGVSLLESIGTIVSAVSSGGNGGLTGSGILNALGASGSGGSSAMITSSSQSTSDSGYVGNESAEDIQEKAVGDETTKNKKTLTAAKEESDEVSINDVNDNIILIHTLLQGMSTGENVMYVKQVDYGLTGWN